MTENNIHDITDLPKKRKIRNPFPKKSNTDQVDASENRKVPYGIYTAGLLLVVAGVAATAASKLGRKDDVEDDSSDTTAA